MGLDQALGVLGCLFDLPRHGRSVASSGLTLSNARADMVLFTRFPVVGYCIWADSTIGHTLALQKENQSEVDWCE